MGIPVSLLCTFLSMLTLPSSQFAYGPQPWDTPFLLSIG